MNNLPSVKTHPVLMALIVVVLTLFLFIAGIFCGWFLRAMSESRAELSVVVDDGKFMQALEVKTQKWIEEFNLFDEEFHSENEIPDCIAMPMPDFYHDNDFSMQPNREYEE